MKRIATAMWVFGSLLAVHVAQASTVAHWDFCPTNSVNGAFVPGNGGRADLDGDGAMDPDDFLIGAADLTGNGNHLTAWSSSSMKWTKDRHMNGYAVVNAQNEPKLGTDSTYNPFITGTDAESITPAQWTVEAVFKVEQFADYSTIVGRNGTKIGGTDNQVAPFYLSTRGTDLAVQYSDVEGTVHTLQVAAGLKEKMWYSAAAVSDGATLSLYLNGEVAGTLDLTTSGTDTALARGFGTWTVACGMWDEMTVDYFSGSINEVAISDEALSPETFVIGVPAACVDADRNGMGDLYEIFFALDTTPGSAQLNLDADTLLNWMEAALWTDPRIADTDLDGINDDEDDDPLSRAVMVWGHSDFSQGDTYDYTGPGWWIGAGKTGGSWSASGPCWTLGAEEHGMLYMDIDRKLITGDLMLELLHEDVTECMVYLDLGETNGTYAVTNLYGNLVLGEDGSQVLDRYVLPLEAYPEASRVIIDAYAGSNPYKVWMASLYIDSDADGLDAEQEAQFGTSDENADSDGDGLSDRVEVLIEHTDPAHPDSDRDGIDDGKEINTLGTSALIPVWKEGGYSGYLQVERWNGIWSGNVYDLINNERFGATPDAGLMVYSSEYAANMYNDGDQFGLRLRGTFKAPVSGSYTFTLTGDDSAQVWLSDTESPYGRSLLLNLPSWTGYHETTNAVVPTATVELEADQDYYVEILLQEYNSLEHVSLFWTLPGESELQLISAGYLHSYVQPEDDPDGDGLPAAWEIANGLDPENGIGGGYRDLDSNGVCDIDQCRDELPEGAAHVDLDNDGLLDWWAARYGVSGAENDADSDGLSNLEEYRLKTDPVSADSDSDGVMDGQEVAEKTDPLNPDTDADGIIDGEEPVQGTDPLNPDTDNDGLLDGEELETGFSPLVPVWQQGGMSGVLQAECWSGIEGKTLAALTADPQYGIAPDRFVMLESTEYAPVDLNAEEYYGLRIRGTITAPVSGTYTFTLTGDDAAQVWLSDSESPYEREQILDLKTWVDLEQLDHPGVPSAVVELVSNQTCYVEILLKEFENLEHVSLFWTLPGESEPEVIGSEYLHSYVQPVDDADADGLSDAWEIAGGLNPTNGVGGGMADTDGDGYRDIQEYAMGLNPIVADEDLDGLSGGDELTITWTDPGAADSDGDGIPDLTRALYIHGSDFVSFADTHIWSTWSSDGSNAIVSEAHSDPWVSYALPVTEAGMYRLAIDATYQRDYEGIAHEVRLAVAIDGVQLGEIWMNHSADLPAYTLYTPWLPAGDHTLRITVKCNDWVASPFLIHGIELGAIDGADADGNGIQDWMEARWADTVDTDGDGILDRDELLLGTNPLGADSDNDGLSDGAELELGTNPLDDDSDDDGVIDGVEVNESMTDPLTAEFDGTVTTVLTVPGAQTNSAAGEWDTDGTEILSQGRRGYVEYTLDFPEQDLYCLNINAAHIWYNSSCAATDPVDESTFQVYVDDIFVGAYPLLTADGVYEDVRAFLPVLPAGEHTVRIFWDNVRTRLAVQIKELQLQSLGGPDANANGVKDWVEAALSATAGVDETSESYISPACIEGSARYVPFISITGGATSSVPVANQGAGERWYANLALYDDDTTTSTVSFQNGALEVPISIDWVPYNLMEHNGETLYIRKGDSVKFTALPAEAVGGQFELGYALDVGGVTESSPNTRPLIRTFEEAGTYSVSGAYTHGNDTVSAAISVVVLDGSFPDENPACLVGKQRDWTFSGLPPEAVLETDPSVELVEPGTANQALRTVSLRASDANGEHMIVARTSPGGPILDSTKLDACWIQNAVDGYVWVAEIFEDSELWEMESIQKNLPESVDVRIKVFVAGVTLDDYTLERWVTNQDYDDTGIYRFRLFHPNEAETSVCHTFMAYQDGVLIGEIGVGEDD